jgi:hypothetical protein
VLNAAVNRTNSDGEPKGGWLPQHKITTEEAIKADISLFQLEEGDYVFSDGTAGNILHGTQLLSPRLT